MQRRLVTAIAYRLFPPTSYPRFPAFVVIIEKLISYLPFSIVLPASLGSFSTRYFHFSFFSFEFIHFNKL
jgi:hypothetical protein